MSRLIKLILAVTMVLALAGCKKAVDNSANSSPEIVSLTTTSAKLGLGQPAVIKCVASDPDGDPLTYVWESSDGGPLDPLGANPNEVVYTTHSCCGGITEITVTVTDDKGGNVKKGLLIEFSADVPVGE